MTFPTAAHPPARSFPRARRTRLGALLAGAALALGVGLLGALGGCDSKAPQQPAANTTPTSAGAGGAGSPTTGAPAAMKKLRVGVAIPAATHGWTAGVGWWAEQAMKMYPDVEWVYLKADSAEDQIGDVRDMMTKGIDALVILCFESAPLTPVAREARERGIYIVNVDRGFTEPVADLFLEGDNQSFGRVAAEFMAQKLGGKGNIVILEGIPSTVNTDRVTAARAVFERFPDIKVLASQPGNWNREQALNVMQNLLAQHPKIDAVWASDDDMLLGAMQAAREAGREKDMWMLGGAGMKDVVKMVMDKDPRVPANVTYPPSMIATGIHLAVSALRDGKREQVQQFFPRHLKINVELITPENAERYYFPESVY
mgnify:CR=1 FL=1